MAIQIQVSNIGLKAVVFHWAAHHFDLRWLADGQVTFADMLDEMMLLHMHDLVRQNHTTVYGAYKDLVRHAKAIFEDVEA